MPYMIDGRRGGRLLAVVTAALALTASPALAARGADPVVSGAPGCDAAVSQPFAFVGDDAPYVLSTGGDVEGSLEGWAFEGGATVVEGSAPEVSGGTSGARSVLVPSGGSVTTAPLCVDEKSPFFRFQARNTGAAASRLKVEVLYVDGPKFTGVRRQAVLRATPEWAPTRRISLSPGLLGVGGNDGDQATIAFRFTALGDGGEWQVDDVYVDPHFKF